MRGIDISSNITAGAHGSQIRWNVEGDESTLDHFTVFVSQDGENLMLLANVAIGQHSLDLGRFGLDPADYTVFVKAVGKPSLTNKMSRGTRATIAPGQSNPNGPEFALSVTPDTAEASSQITASISGLDKSLYVTDLTEANIRQITNPNGDPRTQTVGIVAVTGDGRGANGTIGFIGNNLYISENRAVPSGVFIAGVATNPVNGFVYAADSPGGANANIWRYSLASNTTALYLQGGVVPAAGSPNAIVWCSLTCTRPFDTNLTSGGTAGFSFAFGLYVDTTNGSLYITEDPTAGNRGGCGRAGVAPLVP